MVPRFIVSCPYPHADGWAVYVTDTATGNTLLHDHFIDVIFPDSARQRACQCARTLAVKLLEEEKTL